MASPIDKRDLRWILIIAVSFAGCLAASWERWGNPLVDCGREMSQPLRLARGEMLYSDVRHIYGPLSPYLNSLLYHLFGASLNVLYADGIVTAIVILGLVYWLSRQLMGRVESTAATLSVMLLCAFKQAGNYVLPYSYSALHGCALSLGALALLIKYIRRQREAGTRGGGDAEAEGAREKSPSLRVSESPGLLITAGLVTGLAVLAKTEMGAAALTAGIVTAGATAYPGLRKSIWRLALFAVPAVVLVLAVYGLISLRVGVRTLTHDSFLLLQNLPPELVYFNRRMSGLDEPLTSLVQMAAAAVRIASLALFVGALASMLARLKFRRAGLTARLADAAVGDAGRTGNHQLWLLFVLSAVALAAIPVVGKVQWSSGPYLAMPILLVTLLVSTVAGFVKWPQSNRTKDICSLILIVMAAYALISLTRVILRVRSGGAYSSYLMPTAVILFTYCLACYFPALFRDRVTQRFARVIVLILIFVWLAATGVVLGYRYRTNNTYALATDRGTMYAVRDLGSAFDDAIDLIKRETAPGEAVAVMPEGTSLNFFTDRPNPLREEIVTPGFLDGAGEERAISRLERSGARFIFVTNRSTPEFGPATFGEDYCVRLMNWIQDNFEEHSVITSSTTANPQIGDRTFFVRVFRRK